MFGKIARGVSARPWFVILGWLVASAAIVILTPSLADVTNADQAAFLPDTAESAQASRLAERAFPGQDGATSVIVVKRVDGGRLSSADIAAVGQLAGRLNAGKPPHVLGVQFDPQQSVSPNAAVGLLSVKFDGPAEDEGVRDGLVALRADAVAGLADSDLSGAMTGQAAIVVDNKRAIADAEKIVTLVTVALIVVLLLFIFRSPIAALLPLATVGLVFGVSVSATAAVAKAFDFQVGQEFPTMLTVVLFGIGTDYVLFLLFRYRERLRAGDTPAEAIVAAVDRVGEAIFSAAFAVIAAFSALVLAALGFFTTLGPALAIGVLIMLLAALTLVPAIVSLLGRWVFWPSRSAERIPRRNGFAGLGGFVGRRPLVVVAGALVLLGGLAAGIASFSPDYDPIGQLPAKTESTRAFNDLKAGFPAGALQPTDVYLSADRPLTPTEIGAFVARLAAVPGVASPMAPRVTADAHTVDVPLILADDPFGSAALDLVSGPLRDAAHAAAPAGSSVLVGGQSMAFADVRGTTNRDLSIIFPVAGLLFVLILAGLLRALLAPVYLVAMVVLGFAATLGASTIMFQKVLGQSGLAFTIPIILYLFVTAIGTDYNILITARLREEIRDGRSPREAASLAIRQAGPSVAAAAVILAGTFGALLVSGVPFFVEIGFAVTLGILLVAFVVSLLLVPATTALLGRAAWWPGTRPPTSPKTLVTAGDLAVDPSVLAVRPTTSGLETGRT